MYHLIVCLVSAIAASIPFFETGMNGRILSSRESEWKVVSVTSDTLSNGGIITSTEYAGRGQWSGLKVVWDRETFGQEEFVRERLRMRSAVPGRFRFTDVEGRCHLVFPQYFIPGEASDVQEIRLATFDKDILPGYEPGRAMDTRPVRNPSGCYMFHPARLAHNIPCEVKGPFLSADIGGKKVLLSYEHASQDNVWEGGRLSYGDGTVTDDDLWFISLGLESAQGGTVARGSVRRGAYYDGEPVPSDSWYETVWYTISEPEGEIDDAIHSYLMYKITDHEAARRPEFYYNTWGMQCNLPGSDRENFTEKRILEEIDRAARLGVETIVFDDGWQTDFGVWTPNEKRLPNGLEPLMKALREKGIKPGIWVALLACSDKAPVAVEHPEWVVTDPLGKLRAREWKQLPMDITGGYYDYMLNSLKALTDYGFRFFKWDGINLFSSDLAGLGHGGASTPRKERMDRYNYLLPFKVTSLMRELREYCPDVVIEIDLTEPHRALVGLMPLQEGKLFWMNNGASYYDDYSLTRTKSMRMVASEYSSLIPVEALTYAVYPFDMRPIYPLRYNLCTGIQSGHGYWGNLELCTEKDYETVRYYTMAARRVLGHIAGEKVYSTGMVGSTPEIYLQKKDGYALLTAFSGAPCECPYTIPVEEEKVLGVIGHAFSVSGDGVSINLQFSYPDDSRAVFVVGNDGKPYSIKSSTGWLRTLEFRDDRLFIEAGSPTEICVSTPSGVRTVRLSAGEAVLL